MCDNTTVILVLNRTTTNPDLELESHSTHDGGCEERHDAVLNTAGGVALLGPTRAHPGPGVVTTLVVAVALALLDVLVVYVSAVAVDSVASRVGCRRKINRKCQ